MKKKGMDEIILWIIIGVVLLTILLGAISLLKNSGDSYIGAIKRILGIG